MAGSISPPQLTVAIIGAGKLFMYLLRLDHVLIPYLSMLKTLREDGFDDVILERRKQVGGLWSYTNDKTMTTALPSTTANISKYTCGFTDFPMPDKYPPYLSQSQKTHNFGSTVTKVARNDEDTKWNIEMIRDGNPETRVFDKVVCCSSYQSQPKMPDFKGLSRFEGQILHVQQFRKYVYVVLGIASDLRACILTDVNSPEEFQGKNVVVVSMSDVIPAVVPHAAKVYVSHRRGTFIFSRWRNGLPTDLLVNHVRRNFGYFMQQYLPDLSAKLSKLGTRFLMRKFNLDPAWRVLEDAPSLALTPTACTDNILDLLREGKVTSLHSIKAFLGGNKVEFTDGTVLDNIDTVIFCTGYRADFTIAPFVQHSKPDTDAHGNPYGGLAMPRLYMNTFPPQYADSMAILIASTFGKNNGFSFADVISMAISNIWRGVSSDMIPSIPEIEKAIDDHQKWIAGRWSKESTTDVNAVKQWEFQGFLHDAAGTGLENLGWGLKGWKSWLKDPKMVYLMRHGVETAYAFRYFETGKRATWPGAKDAIIHTNELVKKLKEEGHKED
ncbi:hypothetical protein G7046_g8860 [Stylonectria norvegica]|nr:hypothetical protein G7046_g8860 [Stylonectria norvegica]